MSNNQTERNGYAMSYNVPSADKKEPFQDDMSYKVSSNPEEKVPDVHSEKSKEINPFIAGIRPFSGNKNEPFQVDMSYKAVIGEKKKYRSIQNQNKVEGIVAGQSVKPKMTYKVKGSVAGQSVKPVMTYKVVGIRQQPVSYPDEKDKLIDEKGKLNGEKDFGDGMSYSVNITKK